MKRIEYPWPPKALSPNGRKSHKHLRETRNTYKEAWWVLTKQAKPRTLSEALRITFCPPDGRHRDTDNMLSAIKYGLDGMAHALGINDRQFSHLILVRGEPKRPHGAVFVEFIDAGLATGGEQ